MRIRDEVIEMIAQESMTAIPITDDTHLYRDLHFDSLAFVSLLTELEDRYHLTIELPEMERCLIAGQLIALIEAKWKEQAV